MKIIRPSILSQTYAADRRRLVFDIGNSYLLDNGVKTDVVFIGDSITDFWEVNLFFKGYGKIINRGIGGDVIYGVHHSFDADVNQL